MSPGGLGYERVLQSAGLRGRSFFSSCLSAGCLSVFSVHDLLLVFGGWALIYPGPSVGFRLIMSWAKQGKRIGGEELIKKLDAAVLPLQHEASRLFLFFDISLFSISLSVFSVVSYSRISFCLILYITSRRLWIPKPSGQILFEQPTLRTFTHSHQSLPQKSRTPGTTYDSNEITRDNPVTTHHPH